MQGSGTVDDLMAFGKDQKWKDRFIAYAKKIRDGNKTLLDVIQKDFQAGKFKVQ